ncbi:addiction module protein [Candidatus Thiodictyon syntrophicum]|uniref:addiction module protein n=1 Tax=Candidatus Thiodictyon syntrophicum TaxID=1166950 RepID=UPI0012FD34B8|nr:addiction module protein [Candidatus Thiodictyon syntrophicum]
MNTTDIEGMSVAEPMQVMEAIWASLLKSDSEMESPDWHQDELVTPFGLMETLQ